MGSALSIIGVVTYAVLAWRLKRNGLSHSYRWLFWYAIFAANRIFQSLLFVYFKAFKTDYYFVWWVVTQAAGWILFVLMVLELHAHIFRPYPGLSSFSRRLFQVGLVVSIPLSLLTLLPELGKQPPMNQYIMAIIVLDRGVLTSLIVFLFVLLLSVLWFRLQLPRNAVVHTVVFFLYFFAKVGIAFVFQVFDLTMQSQLSFGVSVAAILCVLGWIFGLTPAGEKINIARGPTWSPEVSEQLTGQLGDLNTFLSRSGRK